MKYDESWTTSPTTPSAPPIKKPRNNSEDTNGHDDKNKKTISTSTTASSAYPTPYDYNEKATDTNSSYDRFIWRNLILLSDSVMERVTCTICHQSFPLTDEYFYRNKNCTCGYSLQCKTCKKNYGKKYFHSEQGQKQRKKYKECGAYKEVYTKFLNSEHWKKYHQNWRHSEIGKLSTKAVHERYRSNPRNQMIEQKWRQKHYSSEKYKKTLSRWRKTESGRKSVLKTQSKRRRLGYNILYDIPFEEDEDIVWHHVNNNDVVALPKDVHEIYCGYDTETHREMLKPIIEQIYL